MLSFKEPIIFITYTCIPIHNDNTREWEYTITPLNKSQLKFKGETGTLSYYNLTNCCSHSFRQDYLKECIRIK